MLFLINILTHRYGNCLYLHTLLDRIWAQSLRATPYTLSLAMPPSKHLKKKKYKTGMNICP